MQGRSLRDWIPAALVVLVALAASVSGIRNEFAQDDVALVLEDERVHTLGVVREVFTESYWPGPVHRDLYRPFATLSFAFQWTVGGGSPLIFRLVSYLLYVLVSLAVLALARRLLPSTAALVIGLLFAAHPVHVEAVALAVNQGEQWVALLSLLVVIRYLDLRQHGWLSPRDWLGLTAMYLVACLFKEHAVVMPGLLLAAELTHLPGTKLGERMRRLGPGFVLLASIGGAFLAVRTVVLNDFAGSFTAEALRDQGLGGRVLTMLQVVPEWGRLLGWPARLQGDYSPAIINQATSWGAAQTLGTLILSGVAMIGGLLWRRVPTVPFGVLWLGVTLLPVSNVLVPSGIVLAERTMFLPSVGFLLVGGAVGAALFAAPGRRLARRGAIAAVVLLVAAGVVRSSLRHRDWRGHVHYWAQTVLDAPTSYRAQHAFAQLLWMGGHERAALAGYNTAMALYPPAWWIRNELGNRFRVRGDCYPALDLYAESLRIEPEQPAVRASRIACFLHLGRYEEAIAEADAAILAGRAVADFVGYRAVADSAARVGALPGTVRLKVADPEERW